MIGPFCFNSYAQTHVHNNTQIAAPVPNVIAPPKQQISTPNQMPQGKVIPPNTKPIQKQYITYAKESVLGKRHYIGLGFGQMFLFGDYASLGEDKIVFDLYYQFKSSLMFKLIANVHAHKFEIGKQVFKTKSANFGIKAKIFDYDKFSPFVGLGFGLYWPSAERTLNNSNSIIKADTKTAFGLNAFTGLDLDVSERFNLSFMAHYHKPFSVSYDNQPDLSGAYLKLLIIPSYRF